MIQDRKTDGVFQLESNMFKGLIEEIKPQTISDIAALNAIGRPGPLSAGLQHQYAKGKDSGQYEYPIRGCEDILDRTFGCPIYQESLMLISKKVSGFDDMQADSLCRKPIAKKRKEMFPMMERCHIYGKKNVEGPEGWENDDTAPWYDPKGKYGGEIKGALANGYTAEEMRAYFDTIMGYSEYCFNASHAWSYGLVGTVMAYLKCHYPTEFYAAVLSAQSDDEKIQKYIRVAEAEGIQVKVPDINLSEASFTPIVFKSVPKKGSSTLRKLLNAPDTNEIECKEILYGLASIKGMGAASIDPIISARPFTSLEDLMARVPKKYLNKRVINALAMSGALDSFNTDRIQLLKDIKALRKDKDSVKLTYMRGKDKLEKLLEYEDWTEDICILMEEATVSTAITYKRWINTIPVEGKVSKVRAHILSHREHMDKNGNMMCFCKLLMHDCEADVTIFSSLYSKHSDLFDPNLNPARDLLFSGKKQGDAKFLASQLYSVPIESERIEVPF